MNTLMISVLVVGALSLVLLRREVFPEFELEVVLITVPYPGASPDEVEEGICQKIEEAVRSIDGIKKQTSIAQEGLGSVVLELEANSDVQRTLNDVRSEVDRIPSFPLLAEDPEVKQITFREAVIQVGLIGPQSDDLEGEIRLRRIAEDVRDDLIQLPAVSQAELIGAKDYQIDIEISEDTLRRYGLTLQEVARIVRRENVEMPGGTIRTAAEEVLIRGKNKRLFGDEIRKIPLVTQPGGVVLSVGDLGVVRDEFADVTSFHRINGRPGMVISVDRTTSEDLLAMTDVVKRYVETKQLPDGYQLKTWGDASIEVRERLVMLGRNGLQGLILVLLVLAIFLELRLAFWVALGIPIAILGACAVLLYSGQTLNMLTTFAFLMALGIVVDDAIVIGENIYTHRQRGVGPVRAAVDGTVEVLPSVFASIATTIIAFVPLLFVSGMMGKFIAVMPATMIAMLVISLVESTIILPCHLAHTPEGESASKGGLTGRVRRWGERRMVETADERWLRTRDLAVAVLPSKLPRIAKKSTKWIDVSIQRQTLLLYQGKTPVFATMVSTGKDGMGDPKTTHSTPRGTFRIRDKHVTQTMDSAVVGSAFELNDVPWVQYFKAGYALHGAYWHTEYGRPRSHGCINLSPVDAYRLFRWTDPPLPSDWHGVSAAGPNGTGTLVHVHP